MMVSVLNTLLQFKIKASVIEMTNLLFIVRNCINDILLRARYTRYTSVRCIMTKNIVNRILVSWWSFLSSLLLFIFHSISFNVYIILKLFFDLQNMRILETLSLYVGQNTQLCWIVLFWHVLCFGSPFHFNKLRVSCKLCIQTT